MYKNEIIVTLADQGQINLFLSVVSCMLSGDFLRIRGKTMCLPSLKGRHNKQVQAHQVHSSVLIKSYYWTGIFINILDDLLKDSLLFIRLIIDIIQIVGPPTFLWDWQKFAFCQSYV
jgi:hypothetical protein